MTIGILVDGLGEYHGLPKTLDKIRPSLNQPVRNPIKLDLQPMAPVGQTARRCIARIRLIEDLVNRVIVLIDREQRAECPRDLALALAREVRGAVACNVTVVIKDRGLENWLVADFDTVSGLGGRFRFPAADRSRVVPNKADAVGALQMLKRAAVRRDYDKAEDALRILTDAQPLRMAANSRSFRKFLRSVGHASYRTQSKRPA